MIDSDRPGNVLQLLLAAVEELGIDFALYVSKGVVGNANLAWRGDSLETGRDVHAISEDVATLNNHVAEIDADAKLDTVVLGESDIAFGHLPPHRDCRSDGSDYARKLDQNAIAGRLDDAPVVAGDLRVDQFAAKRPEPQQCGDPSAGCNQRRPLPVSLRADARPAPRSICPPQNNQHEVNGLPLLGEEFDLPAGLDQPYRFRERRCQTNARLSHTDVPGGRR